MKCRAQHRNYWFHMAPSSCRRGGVRLLFMFLAPCNSHVVRTQNVSPPTLWNAGLTVEPEVCCGLSLWAVATSWLQNHWTASFRCGRLLLGGKKWYSSWVDGPLLCMRHRKGWHQALASSCWFLDAWKWRKQSVGQFFGPRSSWAWQSNGTSEPVNRHSFWHALRDLLQSRGQRQHVRMIPISKERTNH